MTIAGSIITIMLGAILAWAVEFDIAGVDINVIGVILMIGGLVGLGIGLYRIRVTRRVVEDYEEVPEHRHTAVYEERRRYDEPPL
ncbi:MAG: hypothetical protein HOY71_36055 [Nonomuraea sp.]|nr:hypothetical protein [Nonomuraea sp.]